jgi:hypothetical protein
MATGKTVNGVIYGGYSYAGLERSANLATNPVPLTPAIENKIRAALQPLAKSGDLQKKQAQKLRRQRVLSADPITHGFFDMFYNRIHILPAKFDLGNVLSKQERNVSVFNAFFTKKNLQTVKVTGAPGVTLEEPTGQEAPVTYNALEEKTYKMIVSTVGAPQINNALEFTFDGVLHSVRVLGSRIVPYTARQNWDAAFTEVYEWSTGVLRGRSGDEQRFMRRQHPRVTIETENLVNRADMQYVQNLINGWQQQRFAVPLWNHSEQITKTYPAGTTEVDMLTTGVPFKSGGLLMFWRGVQDFEVVEVKSFTADKITLSRPTIKEWGEDSRLALCVAGNMARQVQLNKLTDSITRSNVIRFESDAKEWESFQQLRDDHKKFKGLPFWDAMPDWTRGIETTMSRESRNTVDYLAGPQIVTDLADQTDETFTYEYLLKTRDEIKKFKNLLYRTRGQAALFWVPSWTNDLELIDIAAAGATNLKIRDSGVTAFLTGKNARTAIMLATNSGILMYAGITGIKAGDNDAVVTIDQGVPEQVEPKDVRMFGFLRRVRMDTDTIRIEYITDGIARVSVPFRVRESEK